MVGEVTYKYTPSPWDENAFHRAGGFTIVFFNYNKAPMIERSVQSVLNQDYPCLELLFMDDASSDGSGEAMERLVRSYRGRHKVLVVRNTANQYITGQWNIASRLASGSWLGMFCADDIAHPDRVSIAAQHILGHPTLRGFSTAAVDIDGHTGEVLPDSHYVPSPYFANGLDSPESLVENFRSNGATSFWHISLFEKPLPRVPLDDDYLHYRCYFQNQGVDGPIFFYNSDVKTIDYTIGVGVTSSSSNEIPGEPGVSRRKHIWIQSVKNQKHLAKLSIETLSCLLREYGNYDKFCVAIRRSLLEKEIRAGNTLSRVLLLPELMRYLCSESTSRKFRFKLVKPFAHDFAMEFFGLHFGATVSTLLHK